MEEDLLKDERYAGIRETVRMLPHVPGVYVYKNAQKKIIYIGKAKDLHKRVQSYFTNIERHNAKTRLLVKQIAFIDFIIVNNEEEAFLLENNLIKKNQPKYNILLKDDKSYPWVCITKEEYPRVFLTRNYIPKRGKYYGPYASSGNIDSILTTLRQLFFYRTCKMPMTQEMVEKRRYRACLEYHIHNCQAPCINAISKEEYNRAIENIGNILNGKIGSVLTALQRELREAIEDLQFEKADLLNQQIEALQEYQSKNSVLNPEVGDLDVLTLLEKNERIALNYMHIYNGAVVLSINRIVSNPLGNPLEELIDTVIYRLKEEFGSEALTLLCNLPLPSPPPPYKHIEFPQRGDKHKVLLLSTLNTTRYLEQTEARRQLPTEEAMLELQRLLNLPRLPRHIECIDNSNTLGTYPVSAVVVFQDGKPAKDLYRIYNVQTVEGPNDYATMEEIITRRYKDLPTDSLPDLLVIDGGKGQLTSVQDALARIERITDIPLIGLAERLEEIYVPRGTKPIRLSKDAPNLRLLIQMRDEAHRFGVKHHTHKRDKDVKKLTLLTVKGVGEKSIQKLYQEFGSREAIIAAGLPKIEASIGKSRAALVWEALQEE
ncbi:MAG: excinuclease ABC subunit UvrC [Bacteroides sp.]